jgi:hypothetical protein
MALGDFADYLRFAEKGVQGFGSGKCWACIRAATESLGIDGSLRMPFVGNALLSTKHVLYTAIIFGWPKEYSSMRVPKAKSEVSFESHLVTCTKTGTSLQQLTCRLWRFCRSLRIFHVSLGAIFNSIQSGPS